MSVGIELPSQKGRDRRYVQGHEAKSDKGGKELAPLLTALRHPVLRKDANFTAMTVTLSSDKHAFPLSPTIVLIPSAQVRTNAILSIIKQEGKKIT